LGVRLIPSYPIHSKRRSCAQCENIGANPLAKPITGNDTVWIFDNIAYYNPKTKGFEVEFVAAVFDKHTGLEVSKVVASIAAKLGLSKGAAEEATIRERLMPIMQEILPGRVVNVKFPHSNEIKLGPGGRNAISSDVKNLPKFNNGEVVPSVAVVPEGANGILRMKTVYAEPEGWGVISGRCSCFILPTTGIHF
jgi:hypothetical protein